jgi:SAM-dependent methyltransferase
MNWCCPSCHGELLRGERSLRCEACSAAYPCVGRIPDLRLPGDCWIDMDEDRAQAEALLARSADLPLEGMIAAVFGARPEWTDDMVRRRTAEVLAAPGRLRGQLHGWLRPCLEDGRPFLDVGCGPGMLIAAAAAEGGRGIGVDVSMVWLVVAERMIREAGGEPVLAAALAESLPLADGSVGTVVALDVIEHVADPVPVLRESARVLGPGGRIAMATPNRFSLTAEPHVKVWGVGWVPRRWQAGFVRWRSGKSYTYTRLLSPRELGRLFREHTRLRPAFLIPPVPDDEIERFPPMRARAAEAYNRMVGIRPLRAIFRLVGPFFRVVATDAGVRPMTPAASTAPAVPAG